jgi:predicted ABC-type ATPase
MPSRAPNLIVVAGPNAAGKTTASANLLVGALSVQEFVNADTIAKGLSAFRPESVALQAGRRKSAPDRERFFRASPDDLRP